MPPKRNVRAKYREDAVEAPPDASQWMDENEVRIKDGKNIKRIRYCVLEQPYPCRVFLGSPAFSDTAVTVKRYGNDIVRRNGFLV